MNDCAEKGNLDLNTFNKQIPNPEAHINTRNINTNKKKLNTNQYQHTHSKPTAIRGVAWCIERGRRRCVKSTAIGGKALPACCE